MLRLSILVLLTLHYHTCVLCADPCAQRTVSGIQGGDVTLQLDQTRITPIHWASLPSTAPIATTQPGGYIDNIVQKRYTGRVSSTGDGSLHITNLTLSDQRIFAATIQKEEEEEPECLHFNLTVYRRLSAGDIQISPNVISNVTCSMTLMCIVTVPDVNITWRNINSSNINVTRNVLYVPPSDVNFTYTCTASNPAGNVSKSVVPQQYCNKGPEPDDSQSKRTHIVVAVILLIIAILVVVYFILWKTKIKRKRQEIETPTTYVQVVDSPRHEENQYDSATRPEQSVVTSLYSEVQPVRKNKSQRQENKQNVQPAPETVYSFVANSTESPSQRQNCYKNNGASAQQEVNSVYSTVNHPTVPE
ncbi:SLAM family member 5-like [Mixophyes fleayi]|uniref:SLAM family member 5-like n=1 Tax=Mixophyes fleayi TaxID=3061075 RepID=UPI003F4DF7AB